MVNVSVMYMGSRGVRPPCYCVFLREVLQRLGIMDVPFFSHGQIRWSNSVVFFDTMDAPERWPGLVRHLVDQGNVVIVIFEGLGTENTALVAFKSQLGRSVFTLHRTWEAAEVRAIFSQAKTALAGLAAVAQEEVTQ